MLEFLNNQPPIHINWKKTNKQENIIEIIGYLSYIYLYSQHNSKFFQKIIMKTKQSLKKLIINPSKSIKLKFDNIATEKQNSNATMNPRDIEDIKDMEVCLLDVIRIKGNLTCADAAVCLELIRKLRRLIESQLLGHGKAKFRITKSSRKPKNSDKKLEEAAFRNSQEDQEYKILNVSAFTQNYQNCNPSLPCSFYESQIYTQGQQACYLKSKPAVHLYRTNPINKLKIYRSKSKGNANGLIETQGTNIGIKGIRSSETEVQSLNGKIGELMEKINQKNFRQSILIQKIEQLQSQIKKITKKPQILCFDIQYSLKVIPQTQRSQVPTKNSKKIKIQPTESPNITIIEYQKQLKSNLQNIIISQNRLIQSLYSKLAQQ